MQPYCQSRFTTVRRPTRAVRIGNLYVGGDHPIVVQSMTTTPTLDIDATVRQSIALAEAGCQVVRVTAQNVAAAKALGEIRKRFSQAGFGEVPLVADIHFLPNAALEAVEHVEKVRINPGNYADKKKFQVREYSDADYNAELERLHAAFSPIVLRAKELGRCLRIGTNHGSLSDRIMNRYGDSPMGMCESALEFIRIAESHGFRDIVLSMKASNPKVMIQAYRLIVARMLEEDMHYPLHLGVTEAGDGDDARIKSAIGIGSLLYDGLGDTIRVSLTEDPVYEIPVARALAERAMALWREAPVRNTPDAIDPYTYNRRPVAAQIVGKASAIGPLEPPRVLVCAPDGWRESTASLTEELRAARQRFRDLPIEGLIFRISQPSDLDRIPQIREAVRSLTDFCVWDLAGVSIGDAKEADWSTCANDILVFYFHKHESAPLEQAMRLARQNQLILALDADPAAIAHLAPRLQNPQDRLLLTLSTTDPHDGIHPLGAYRQLAEVADALPGDRPIWIRNTPATSIAPEAAFSGQLLEASMLSGALLCDGLGDIISIETVPSFPQALTLAYNVLQGARARTSKTEYVACPSCGRTLFDLQSTTQRIRAATGHLKGVTIAVMGCIVNGPGEMADADFGYVGGAPGKVNLYVGKECVRYHIPADQAVDALIDLIREHGKWVEPEAPALPNGPI
ncbi:MAG: (E)-4-hydroxy-3-methylbut-2-enyl-diphosphate synthase [Opitutales bacterium]|nr:(E)-4-hydroxy-3-methylbut-2-enyl-diphosphate synthase [Opitutales bacterium]